jgi:ketosteroid isomerase-like protein
VSEENVHVVRKAWEAHGRRDNEAALRLYDPDVEIYNAIGEVYRGMDGVHQYFRDWYAVIEGQGAEVGEWIDAGEQVIAVMRASGRGKSSGAAVEQDEFHVWTVRGGRLARLRIYTERADALAAAGLAR